MKTLSKKIITLSAIGILILSAFAINGCKEKTESTEPAAAMAVDEPLQKMCPIMDAPINKELYTEYKGKKVYFCCPGCKEKFEADPEKYLSKLPQFE